MPRPLLVLLLALLVAGAGAASVETSSAPRAGSREAAETPTLRVTVLRGRAQYLLPEGGDVRTLTSRSRPLVRPDGAYLEFGIGTEVELAFSAGASVRLSGPGIVSWTPTPPGPQESARERLELVLVRVERAEVESRGARLDLELVNEGWGLELSGGALHLERRPNRDVVVRHHGGRPLRLRSRLLREPGSWPVRLYSGERVTLRAPR